MSDEQNPDGAANPTRAVVPVNAPSDLVGALVGDQGLALASFDVTTVEGRQLLQKCEESPDFKVREIVNKRIRLQNVYIKRIDLVDSETSEVHPANRICLIDVDGSVSACCSDGIRLSVARFLNGGRKVPFDPPIVCEVRVKALGGVKQRLWLEEVFEAPSKGKK